MMLTITLKVKAPAGQAIGVKEQIAMALEKFGDVRVVNIEDDIEKSGEQVGLFEKGRERK
jgi:hypothetical protein